ncbi:hypothetical protein QBC38DRAFT_482038 [Podospora fimiseda]|uniref:Bromo domain-containing protein n=1 Tax=Podospora fimiseda TaxID=252190 RepID=A0AAN7BM32_9PEZI|nr:hypothetical protein QBC38DRAFT_482038 [Podospora fimiseda]
MNTSTITASTSFTPLEIVLLFRGIGQHGLEIPAFSQIATALQSNNLLKNEPTYDVRRLTPESLKNLFLRLLWEELKAEHSCDGALSPTSKRRKLEALSFPTLDDARRHLDKVELAYAKSHEAYIRHTINEIRSLERKFDHAQAELDDIERPSGDEENEVKVEPAHRHLNGVHDTSTLTNGVGPSPKGSPKPSPRMAQLPAHPSPFSQPPQIQPPQHHYQQQQQLQQVHPAQQPTQQTQQTHIPVQAHQVQQVHQAQQQQQQVHQQQSQLQQPNQVLQPLQQPLPQQHQQRLNQQPQHPRPQLTQQSPPVVQHQNLRPLQPSLPHLAPRQDVRNGPGALPAQQLPGASAPRLPGLNHPQITRSPQLPQPDLSRVPVSRPQEQAKTSSGPPQVLQAPQGMPSFQPLSQSPIPMSEGLQRPDGVGARQATVSGQPGSQVLNQGQLKWEPPYQPSANGPRPPMNVLPQQHGPNVFSTPQHMLSAQRPPQIPPPIQAQPTRNLQQIQLPPHTASQFAPPLQAPPPVRPTVDTGGGQVPNRPQPAVSSPGPIRQQPSVSSPGPISNPQSPFNHGPLHSYPLSGPHPPPPPPLQTTQTNQPPLHQAPSRPPVSSPTVPPTTATARPAQGLVAPSHQRPIPPNLQNLPVYSQAPLASGIPSPMQVDGTKLYNSQYQPPPRAAAVERIHQRLPVDTTPGPAARFSRPPSAPQTPATGGIPKAFSIKVTKWKETSTPSTPRPGVELRLGWDDMPSPAIEPISPVLRPTPILSAPIEQSKRPLKTLGEPLETPASKRKAVRPSTQHSNLEDFSPSTVKSQTTDESASQPAPEQETPKIKDEEVTTPRQTPEVADTIESTAGRHRASRTTKRKREDLSPSPSHRAKLHITDSQREESSAPAAPNLVLWTRSFNKVSGSAMEQIVHHRSANMFAQPIREKDAPGYHKVILHPQDLKSIRAAINHGNRAAAQEAASLPAGDSGMSSWLPRTEELVPPKSIINSGQLDRELAHMFSNAIMYNPDPFHGPGPAFLRETNEDGEGQDGGAHQENVLGYKVDEFGVVKDARAMFVEVEKLLSELRSAEKMTAPPSHGFGGGGTGTAAASAAGTRQGSVAQEDQDEQDEQTATETENNDGRSKRRRVGRSAV